MRKKKPFRYIETEQEIVLESEPKILGGFVILVLITSLVLRHCDSPQTTKEPAKETKIKTILTPDQESRVG